MSIGENVKKLREQLNLTQQALGDAVGVSRVMITQIERGTKALNLQLAKDVSEVLKCDVNDFYK